MTRAELKQQAKDTLRGRWGKAIGILLVYFIITYLISLVLNLIPYVGAIAELAITVPISFGLIGAILKYSRNEEVSVIDFLKIAYENFGRSWSIVWNTIKKLWVYVLILVILVVAMTISLVVAGFSINEAILSSSSTVDTTSLVNQSIGFSITTGILYIAIMVVSIMLSIKALYYELATYIGVDSSELSAKEAVEKSEKLMTGHRWELFVLSLSFIGWMILGTLTFGIGLLWVIPYMQVTMVKYYEYLNANGNSENGNVEVIQNNQ